MESYKHFSSENKVVKAGIGYTAGNYLLKGLSFFSIPIFARLMETSDYGIYNSFVAYESVLFILVGLAIHTSYKNARYKYKYISEGAERGKDYQTYVSDSFLLVVLNALVWLVLAFILGSILSKALGLSRENLLILVIYSFSSAVLTCFNADISLRYDYKRFLAVSAVNAVSNIGISILLMLTLFDHSRYEGRIIGTTVPAFVIAVSIVILYWRQAKPQNNRSLLLWGLKYSLPIVPHGISQVILSQFDRIMIMQMINSSAAGIYSFAYNIYSILNVTFSSLDSVWSPWFYERRKNNDFKTIKEKSSLYILLMLLISSILMLISPELIILLGGYKYSESKYCVLPIVAGGFFTFLYNIPCSVEYYHEKTKLIALGTGSAALINIVLNYIFILRYGYIAAAYTTLITYILYFSFHFFIAKHIEGRNIFSTKIILLSATTIIVAMFCCVFFINNMVLRWFLAVLMGVVTLWFGEKYFHIFKVTLSKVFHKE